MKTYILGDGSETSIYDCRPHRKWGKHNCGPNNCVELLCQNVRQDD